MMIGEIQRHHQIHVPPWQQQQQQQSHTNKLNSPVSLSSLSLSSSPPVQSNSPTYYDAVLASLRRYLLTDAAVGGGGGPDLSDPPPSPGEFSGEMDIFSSDYDFDDEFFMYDFKVRKCTRARAHDWTECPFAHPGEKARRRDPRKYNYSGTACTEFRKGGCKKGDACEFAHGVFECWLHPARFRTQACKDGPGCNRRVCFFAHTPDQLRASGSGLPSPRGSPRGGYLSGSDDTAVGELVTSIRNLQLNKVKSMPLPVQNVSGGGCASPVFGSLRGIPGHGRAGFFSLPTTPTRPGTRYWDSKEVGVGEEDEMVMERVESGRELRARMFEKLSKENPLDGSGSPLSCSAPGPGPDFGWVSDLIE